MNTGFIEEGNAIKIGSAYPQVAYYLTNEYKLPDTLIPLYFECNVQDVCRRKHLCSAIYARNSIDLWNEFPGASEWLLKMVNTYLVSVCLLNPNSNTGSSPQKLLNNFNHYVTLNDEGMKKKKLKVDDWKTIEYFLKRGTYSSSFLESRMLEKSFTRSFNIKKMFNYLKAKDLLSKKAESDEQNKLTTLHEYVYHCVSDDLLDMMIRTEEDIHRKSPNGGTVISMAVYRGNHVALKYCFNRFPDLGSKTLLCNLFQYLLNSGCYFCFHGKGKCTACIQCERNTHQKNTSFTLVVEILIQNGLKLKWIKSSFKDYAKHPLYRYAVNGYKNILKKKKKKKRGSLSPTNLKKCFVCKITSNEMKKLDLGEMKKCSRCGKVKYCSRNCQKKHWKVHKKTCKKN